MLICSIRLSFALSTLLLHLVHFYVIQKREQYLIYAPIVVWETSLSSWKETHICISSANDHSESVAFLVKVLLPAVAYDASQKTMGKGWGLWMDL